MRNVQAEAAYFREALRLGVVGIGDVISWSDSIIRETPTPDDIFIHLSGMSKSHPLDMLAVLKSISRNVTVMAVLPSVLGNAHELLVGNPTYGRKLAKTLYDIYVENDYKVPNELNEISRLDDAFDLAISGTYGTVEEAQEDILRFTGKFTERANKALKSQASPAGTPQRGAL